MIHGYSRNECALLLGLLRDELRDGRIDYAETDEWITVRESLAEKLEDELA